MEKIKSVISGNRNSADATREGEASPSAAQSGHGASTGAAGSEGFHPIYDQFKGPHDQPGTAGESTRTSKNIPHFSNTTNVNPTSTGVSGTAGREHESNPLSSRQHGSTSQPPDYLAEDASTASIRSGVIGFPEGGHDTHASLGHDPIKRELDHNQLEAGPGQSSIVDRTVGGQQNESSHLGRDAALGAGALGAGGAATHELQHQKGDVRGVSGPTTGQSTTRPLESETERRTENPSSGIAGLFHKQGHDSHPERKTEQVPQQHFGEEKDPRHRGTDGAVGAGVLGAGGAAAHEHSHRHEDDTSRTTRQPDLLTAQPTSQHPSGLSGEQDKTSHLGRDAAIGAGAIGAGGLAAHTLSNRREDDVSRDPISQTSETQGITGTARSFPLAGGVTGGQPTGYSSAIPSSSTTQDRELGTKEREAGIPEEHGHGREALAGAAAAAAASSAIPHSGHEHEREHTHTGLGQTGTAAATAPAPGHDHDHAGYGHTYVGDPCESGAPPAHAGTVFSNGPHSTDTANRLDPHLHIPGGFPDPTPVEEISEPSFGRDAGVGGATASAGGLSDTTRSGPTGQVTSGIGSDKPTSEHHYGRDAAIAGGAGAAGLGAAAAGNHHQQDERRVEGDELHTGTSPYSSKTVDPRVYGKSGPPSTSNAPYVPASQIPVTSNSTSERDAAMAKGQEGSKSHGGLSSLKEKLLPSSTKRETNEPTSRLPQPTSQAQDEQSKHHYGRDAALVGAGAAGAGGLYAGQRGDKPDTGPASETIGPHNSNAANVVDPRVQPDPSVQKHQVGSTSTPEDPASKTIGPHKSNLTNILDPRVQPDPTKQKSYSTTDPSTTEDQAKHHYGRDAALVGGAGTIGAGAYATSQDAPKSDFAQQLSHESPAQGTQQTEQPSQHHYGRDAAVVGGLGAAGAGAYGATRGNDSTHQPRLSQENQQPTSSQQLYEPDQNQHQKRDAAALGAAGVAGGAAAGYGLSQHDADKAEKERLKAREKELEHQRKEEQKALEKNQHDQQKALDKERHDQQKALDKEHHKEEKQHDKVIAAEAKHHQKEAAKEEKKHEKGAEKAHKEEEKGEKKHHFFGFLHRDKKDKDKVINPNATESGAPRDSADYSRRAAGLGAAGVGATGAGAYGAHETRHSLDHDSDSDGKRERNRLHKDPPPGHPAREVLEHQGQDVGGKHEHVGIDGPIGRPNEVSGDHTTQSGVYGAHEPDTYRH